MYPPGARSGPPGKGPGVPAAFRPLALLLVLACALVAAGCGRDEVEAEVQERVARVEERVQARVDRARTEFE